MNFHLDLLGVGVAERVAAGALAKTGACRFFVRGRNAGLLVNFDDYEGYVVGKGAVSPRRHAVQDGLF